MNSGKHKEAIPDLELISQNAHTFDSVIALSYLADCYVQERQYGKAVQTLDEILRRPVARMIYEYPRILFLAAKANELNGDRTRAKELYTKFLAAWRLADPDLPELAEARQKLIQLQ